MAWTSHCDIDPYTGWIMAYDADTLAQSSVLNITPNGSRGGFWMAGAGPAVDPQGNIYLLDGNGTFDTTLTSSGFPSQGNFGNAFLKIAASSGLAVADYFATFDTVAATNADRDLGFRRHARPAGSSRWHGPDPAPGRRRRQRRSHLRGQPRRDGQVECVVQPELPGHQRRAGRFGVLDARLLQQHGVLRRLGQHAQGVRRHERPAGDRVRRRQAPGRSRIRGPLRASRLPAMPMESSGRSKTRIPPSCTPTMRRI